MMRKAIRAAFFAMLAASPVAAQSSDPAWLDALKQQAASTEQCEVELILSLRDYELGGRPVQEARIRYKDGRTFDAARGAPDREFEFKACDIQVC